MTIRNTAGAKNFQAVALKVAGDQTAVWRCSLEGYQDTLYALSQRQFYKNCTIYGTVDFIFGNAAAVFQTCTLLARAPIPGQQNTFTAQGRTIQAQNTGFSFQNCTIGAAPELKAAQSAGQFVASYLGRPWKLYSRTVYLQNSISSVINPAGWLPWNGSFALSTLFYGEYKNTGPGAAAGQRVSWSTQITSSKVATQYTVDNFISGALWLPQTTIDFFPQLISTSTGKKVTKPVKPKPKS
jgi:pectinesterase